MTHRPNTGHASGAAPGPLLRTGIAGLLVALWYAAPDYLHGKGQRAVAKIAVIGGAVVALAGGRARSSAPSIDDEPHATPPSRGAPTPSSTCERLRNAKPGLVLCVGGVLLVAGVGLNIASERWIHRFGNRLASQGTLLPHTAIGLVAGSLTVLAGLDDFPARQRGNRPAPKA